MSKISTIYDTLLSTVTTALPTHKELINPYFPETSDELSYSAALGLAFAEGLNALENLDSGIETRQRVFVLSLTRRVFALKADRDARRTTEKDLFEDQKLVIDKFGEDRSLGLPSVIRRVQYLSDGGVEFLRSENNRVDILILRTIIQVDYEEEVPLCT